MRREVGPVVLAAVCLGLLATPLNAVAGLLRHRGVPAGPVAVAGSALVVPADARTCATSSAPAALVGLRGDLQARCLPSGTSPAALDRWVRQHEPVGAPLAGVPWCGTRVLGDGSRLYQWGRSQTTAVAVSDPRSTRPHLLLVAHGGPCG